MAEDILYVVQLQLGYYMLLRVILNSLDPIAVFGVDAQFIMAFVRLKFF